MTKASIFLLLTLALLTACTKKPNLISSYNVEQEVKLLELKEIIPPNYPKLVYNNINTNPHSEVLLVKKYNAEIIESIIFERIKSAIIEYILTKYPNRCEIKSNEIAHYVVEVANEYEDIDYSVIIAIIEVESRFKPEALNRRSKAVGLMQIMPFWGKHFNLKSIEELFKIQTNIESGVKILKFFLDEQNGNMKEALYRYVGGCKKYSNKVLELTKQISEFINKYI